LKTNKLGDYTYSRIRKQSKTDKARMLNISEGSLEECRYYLILAKDLEYTNNDTLWELTEEIGRLLTAYRRTLLSSPIS